MKYCCKDMKEMDEKEIIDYVPHALTTLDVKRSGYPIHFCPFCGKKLKETKKFVKEMKKRIKNIESGKEKLIPIEELEEEENE